MVEKLQISLGNSLEGSTLRTTAFWVSQYRDSKPICNRPSHSRSMLVLSLTKPHCPDGFRILMRWRPFGDWSPNLGLLCPLQCWLNRPWADYWRDGSARTKSSNKYTLSHQGGP